MKLNAATLKAYAHILLPSGMGVLVYVLLSALTQVRYHFVGLQKYLYVPPHINVEGYVLTQIDHGFNHLLGTDRTNTVVLAAFWAIVGLFVFFFINSLTHLFHEVGEDLEERKFIRPAGYDRNLPLKLFLERAAFRVVVFVLILVYLNHIITPVLHGQPFVHGASSIVDYVIWFVVECLVWHGLVILLRLLTLRARLFG